MPVTTEGLEPHHDRAAVAAVVTEHAGDDECERAIGGGQHQLIADRDAAAPRERLRYDDGLPAPERGQRRVGIALDDLEAPAFRAGLDGAQLQPARRRRNPQRARKTQALDPRHRAQRRDGLRIQRRCSLRRDARREPQVEIRLQRGVQPVRDTAAKALDHDADADHGRDRDRKSRDRDTRPAQRRAGAPHGQPDRQRAGPAGGRLQDVQQPRRQAGNHQRGGGNEARRARRSRLSGFAYRAPAGRCPRSRRLRRRRPASGRRRRVRSSSSARLCKARGDVRNSASAGAMAASAVAARPSAAPFT